MMDLIERYVYAVTRQLPANQRAEVEKELQGLIQDMLLESTGGRGPARKDVERVLLELGDPAQLADKYRGTRRFLIGPEHYDTYVSLLRIVVAAVALGLTIAMGVGFVVNPPGSLWEGLFSYVTAILGGVTRVFAGITIVFALFEYFGVNLSEFSRKKGWGPAELPRVPAKNARIRPAEPIAGIVFTVLFLILLNAANHLIGIYFTDPGGGLTVIPLFNPEVFQTYLPYFNLLLLLAIGKECLKLVIGKWTLPLVGINILHNAASLIVMVTAFSNLAIWNPGFLAFILESGVVDSAAQLESIMAMAAKGLMGVVAFALILDAVISLARGVQQKIAG